MAHLRKQGKRYYAEFYDRDRHPKRKWIPLGTSDKRGAMHKLADLDKRYLAGLFDPWEDAAPREGMTLHRAIERFIKGRSDRRTRTLRNDRSTLELLAGELPPDVLVKQITPKSIKRFLERGELTTSTRTTYYARLKRFFRWAIDNGAIKADPMSKIKRPKQKKTVAEFLTRDQYEAVVRCIEADATMKASTLKPGEVIWLADVVRFAVGTGLRLGELCNLRWSAVNLKTGFITVRASEGFDTKSGHERSVYVTGEARDVLARLYAERTDESGGYVFTGVGGDKLNDEYVSKRFLRYARLAKLPKRVSFHTLRHTYASWLVMAGVDLFRVKELLGHASIETTMRYAHLQPKSFKSEIERVFGDGSEPGRVEDSAATYRLAA
jgi:integrase